MSVCHLITEKSQGPGLLSMLWEAGRFFTGCHDIRCLMGFFGKVQKMRKNYMEKCMEKCVFSL